MKKQEKTEVVRFRASKELKQMLEVYSENMGMSVSELIRCLIGYGYETNFFYNKLDDVDRHIYSQSANKFEVYLSLRDEFNEYLWDLAKKQGATVTLNGKEYIDDDKLNKEELEKFIEKHKAKCEYCNFREQESRFFY